MLTQPRNLGCPPVIPRSPMGHGHVRRQTYIDAGGSPWDAGRHIPGQLATGIAEPRNRRWGIPGGEE